MLTARDKAIMASDIDGIIYDNATPVDIWIPKVVSNDDKDADGNDIIRYNDLLQEYIDPNDPNNFTILHEVPIDILDMPDSQLVVESPAGTKIIGKAIMHIPLQYKYKHTDDTGTEIVEDVVVDIDDSNCVLKVPDGTHVGFWYPHTMKYRTGEIVVMAYRLAGYNGSNT